MTPNRKKRGRGAYLSAAFLALAVVLVFLVMKKYRDRNEFPSVPASPEAATHSVVLFFGSPSGDTLVREAREVDPCDDLSACIYDAVEELVIGPLGEDLTPVLPQQATVHDVTVDGETATVDFGPELKAGLPEGASAEMAAVYSIVDTIAVNFPQIARVRITINGKPVETLGDMDLREPLAPDFRVEAKPEPGKKEETQR
jgi:spore germination protein GerM